MKRLRTLTVAVVLALVGTMLFSSVASADHSIQWGHFSEWEWANNDGGYNKRAFMVVDMTGNAAVHAAVAYVAARYNSESMYYEKGAVFMPQMFVWPTSGPQAIQPYQYNQCPTNQHLTGYSVVWLCNGDVSGPPGMSSGVPGAGYATTFCAGPLGGAVAGAVGYNTCLSNPPSQVINENNQPDVWVKASYASTFGTNVLDGVVAHELGHALGLNHSAIANGTDGNAASAGTAGGSQMCGSPPRTTNGAVNCAETSTYWFYQYHDYVALFAWYGAHGNTG